MSLFNIWKKDKLQHEKFAEKSRHRGIEGGGGGSVGGIARPNSSLGQSIADEQEIIGVENEVEQQ